VQGWMLVRAGLIERVLFILAGLLLVYPTPTADVAGIVLVLVAVGIQWWKRRAPPPAPAPA
jgi:TRAP-type uncharacterized transport system fused permease subunit